MNQAVEIALRAFLRLVLILKDIMEIVGMMEADTSISTGKVDALLWILPIAVVH
jgi:hypothetical protein